MEKCIKPLYNKENIKIIVIDNSSSDNTVELISTLFPDVELIISNVNLGFGQANNKGFEYAINNNYDYVFLLNQDASIELDSLLDLVDIYKTEKDIGILSPVHFKNNEEIENVFKYYLEDNKLSIKNVGKSIVEKVKFVNAALWLISVEKLKFIGGFNPLFFHYGEDVEYINRVTYNKLHVVVALGVKAYHYREYSKKEFIKKFEKSTYFGPWNIKYYTILSDINYSFFSCLMKSFYLFLSSFYKYFIKGYFKACRMCVLVYFRMFYKLVFIYNSREISKEVGASFLNKN